MSWWIDSERPASQPRSRFFQRRAWLLVAAIVGTVAAGWPAPAIAERGVLVVHVKLASDKPLPRLRIGTVGDGSRLSRVGRRRWAVS